ncbi:putative Ig domain-containing protein [Xanthomonas dyei]|uniref:putative Ig domain-containing protein n=1 Tax=Xanthomonas dyei TaxID=743699 RepID=UPI000E1E36D4|nr:putative Ig domain-containing protein [Xanthomonas dyei]
MVTNGKTKTVYTILGDMDTPNPPPIPDSENSKKLGLMAFILELGNNKDISDFSDESIKMLTEQSIEDFTVHQLEALAGKVRERIGINPEYARLQGIRTDYVRFFERWKQLANTATTVEGRRDAAAITAYAEFMLEQNDRALAAMRSASAAEIKRGVSIIGKNIGRTFKVLDVIGALKDNAHSPQDAMAKIMGGVAGFVVADWLWGAAGGLAALMGVPVLVAGSVIAGILVAGYAASQIGEAVWDALVSDGIWEFLDQHGLKTPLESLMVSVGVELGGDAVKTIYAKPTDGGAVIASDPNENLVLGNDGSNEITMLGGRTVAKGEGGDDVYYVTATTTGTQEIVDSKGDNRLKFGISDVSSQTYERIGNSNLYRSAESYFTLTYIAGEGDADGSLIVASKHFDANVKITGWSNGDFGIVLPGLPIEEEPVPAGTSGTPGPDYINPAVEGVPAGTAVNLDGSGGRDMIWGGHSATNDRLRGGDGDDIINGRGGEDIIEGGEGDDLISGFGDGSTIDGGTGDDIIDATMYAGWNYAADGSIPISEDDIWRDHHGLFTWTRNSELTYNPQTFDLGAVVSFNNSNSFNYSGASTVAGWTYNFRLQNGVYNLVYTSASEPDGVATASGVISYFSNIATFTDGVTLLGGSGNDSITGSLASDHIDGGFDNDVLVGGAGDDFISGGSGDDQIAGGADNDVLSGADGNDLIVGEAGRDIISGGLGNDKLWGDRYDQTESNASGGEDDYIDGGEGEDELAGQGGNDILDTGEGNDFAFGGAGDDLIQGRGGNDYLQGDIGDDTLFGGEGDDTLHGNEGNDSLSGGKGDDQLSGGDGNDMLDGADGNDTLVGGAASDRLNGGVGNDKMWGEEGDDSLIGGAGSDTLDGGAGSDLVDGGEERDFLFGGAGDDRVYGGAGADELAGDDANLSVDKHGRDVLDGGTGDDVIEGQGNDDVVLGGAGNDSLYGDDSSGRFSGNDTLSGGEGDDYLMGGAGTDMLSGEQGNDVLFGDAGNDTLSGGDGQNQYRFRRGFGNDTVLLKDGSADRLQFLDGITADELLYAREGQDLLVSLDSGDSVRINGYFTGATSVQIQTSDLRVVTRAQLETGILYGSPIRGSTGTDSLIGTDSDDRLYGFGGDDVIDGGEGNDLIESGSGNDTLTDGRGGDTLLGGDGNDIINLVRDGMVAADLVDGGSGDDTYNVRLGSGYDTIGRLDAADAGRDVIRMVGVTSEMITNFQISGTTLGVMIASNSGSPSAGVSNVLMLEGFLANKNHRIVLDDGVEFTTADFESRWWSGTNGDDVQVGTFAPDSMDGGAGNDTLSGQGGIDNLQGGDGDDVLDGGEDDDWLYDGAGTDIVMGGAGNDRIYASIDGASDRLIGGSGNDRYYYNHNFSWSTWRTTVNSSEIEELEGGGTDTIYSNYHDVTLGANIENAVITPSSYWWPGSPNRVTGNALDNVIQILQTSTSDTQEYILDGAGGKDTLIGGATRDTYIVDSLDDVIVEESFYDNSDTVQASIDYSIEGREQLENLRLTGTAIRGTGNSDANIIEGHLVDAVNQLAGLDGNDTYLVTRKDVVIEQVGGGNDTVAIAGWDELTSQSMWLSVSDYANVENLRLYNVSTQGPDGTIALRGNLQGDAGDNVLTGNMYANEIRGGAGNDAIRGNHFLTEFSLGINTNEADKLYGEDGDDIIHAAMYGADIYGGRGNDVLHGTVGFNGDGRLYGARAGSDNFYYEAGDGTDRIISVNGSRDTDRVIFGEGIIAEDAVWTRDGFDLVIQLATAANDRLIIQDYWRQDWSNPDKLVLVQTIDEFVFVDGTIRRGDLAQLQITNDPPVANWFQYDVNPRVGEAFSLALPAGSFVDDADDTLTYSVDGPEWLQIDAITGTISGTPPLGLDRFEFSLIATDQHGAATSVYKEIFTTAVIEGGSGDDILTGTWQREELRGMGGNDRLLGNGGNDVLIGGIGDDTYVLDIADMTAIVEFEGEGTDTVESSVYSYATDNHIERVVLVEGSGAQMAYGSDGRQTLIGNGLDNTLDGGGGADDMRGGAGNDSYYVDDTGDVVVELTGQGTDTIYAMVSATLAANVENGYLDGDGALSLTGNALANRLYGNDDNNVLDGGQGNDIMEGYGGDDTYHVDSDSDRVTEVANAGIDTIIRSTGSQVQLTGNVENLRLTGAGQATGNALDNVIEGSEAANTLLGLAGNDTLYGRGGNDQLTGGAGNDQLIGGAGDDTYVVDATSGSDTISNIGGGSDTLLTNGVASSRLSFRREGNDLVVLIDGATAVAARVSGHFLGGDATMDFVQASNTRYTAAQIAQLIAGGGFDQTLNGTAAGERLTGGAGRDLIDGLGGNDTLLGMAGNDTLRGGAGNDTLSGGGGNGTVSGDDTLEGGAGNDTLRGEDGNDMLLGGAGDDIYIFGGGRDVIDNTGGGIERLQFQDGQTVNNLQFTRDGDDLLVTVGGNANNSVRVSKHFLGGDFALDLLQPGSGTQLDTVAINARVASNAGGTPGGSGDGEANPADYARVLTGTTAGEQLVGNAAKELIRGLAGNDTLFGMAGDDRIEGGDGDDYLSGGSGSFSGSGNDMLYGGSGNDTLVGEDGNDLMFGGAGDDAYTYQAGNGVDTVTTGGGNDYIFMSGIARVRLSFHRTGDDLVVRVDGNANQQVQVVRHFLGGDNALRLIQPDDGGFGMPPSEFEALLTPMGTSTATASMRSPTASIGRIAATSSEVTANNTGLTSVAGSLPVAPQPMQRSALSEINQLIEAMGTFSTGVSNTDFASAQSVIGEAPLWVQSYGGTHRQILQLR